MSSSDLITCIEKQSFRIKRKFLIKWMIHDFICEQVKGGEALPSTKFEFNYDPDTKFHGQLSLVGDQCVERQFILELSSSTLDKWRVWVDLGFGNDVTETFGAALNQLSNKATWDIWSNKGFCILSKHLKNNAIKITCTISHVIYTENESPFSGVFDDYDPAELFETKANSDITFVVAGTEVQAHKSILADRSHVFAAIFEENESDKITITDIGMEVFQELLRFIYTGKDVKVTNDLLAASDKFALPDLKALCEEQLCYHFSVNTVTKSLIYADMYKISKLKKQSIKYIHDNLVPVTESEGWLKLVHNYSHLLADIFT